MMRFLLSLAILVMACGLSFGQGAPDAGGGTGGDGGGDYGAPTPGAPHHGSPATISFVQVVRGHWLPNLYIQAINNPHPLIDPYRAMEGRVAVFGHFTPLCNNGYVKDWDSHLPDAGTHMAAFPGMYPSNNPNYPVTSHQDNDVKVTPYFKGNLLQLDTDQGMDPRMYCVRTLCVISDLSYEDAQTEIQRQTECTRIEAEDRPPVVLTLLDGTQETIHWKIKALYFKQPMKDTPLSFNQGDFHCTPLPNGKFKVQVHQLIAIHLPSTHFNNLSKAEDFFVQPE